MAWLVNWNRRKQLYLSSTNSATQSSYQMMITVNYGTGTDGTPANNIYCGNNVNSNFSDIRFTDTDGVTLLNYWIETYVSSSSAIVWVQIPSIPSGSNSTYIYIYYNNTGASSVSNGTNTFDFFDDFSGDTSKWTVVSGTWSITNDIYSGSGTGYATKTGYTFTDGIIEARQKTTSGRYYNGVFYRFTDLNNYYQMSVTGGYDRDYILKKLSGTITEISYTAQYTGDNAFHRLKTIAVGSSLYFYKDGSLVSMQHGSNPTTDSSFSSGKIALGGDVLTGGVSTDWIFVRKYASPEPIWVTIGTEQLPVTLNINSTPSGAEVWLASPSGQSWADQNVQTPKTLYVPADTSYDVMVGLGGYQPWTVYNVCTGNCTAGSIWDIIADLVPQPGTLAISSTPSGAEIYLALSPETPTDQLTTTITGGTTINLSPGTYNILLRLTGYIDWTGTTPVASNTTTSLSATFSGSANITSTPSGASIYLDGSPTSIGTTPMIITNLTSATSGATANHSYTLILTGYIDTSGSFTATAGQTVNIPVTFPGSLYIESIPPGTSIYIDGILQ